MTTTNLNASNDLRYSATRTVGNETITVKIRLNDECKNGHQDFSVTGEVYEAGKPRTDRNMISCGCVHDYIEKAFPEFKQFINLHLCDYDGVPMHAVSNMRYHIQQGKFSAHNSKIENFKSEFCEYYRVTPEQFYALKECKNDVQMHKAITSLGIREQWKAEAIQAIAALEALTGKTFVNDSKRSQYNTPTDEAIKEEEQRQADGYYTPKAEAERAEAKKQGILDKLKADRDKEIATHQTKYEVMKEVFLKGGEKALKNCIFYKHTNTVSFNWKSYDDLPVDFVQELIKKLILPEGVKAEISKNK